MNFLLELLSVSFISGAFSEEYLIYLPLKVNMERLYK